MEQNIEAKKRCVSGYRKGWHRGVFEAHPPPNLRPEANLGGSNEALSTSLNMRRSNFGICRAPFFSSLRMWEAIKKIKKNKGWTQNCLYRFGSQLTPIFTWCESTEEKSGAAASCCWAALWAAACSRGVSTRAGAPTAFDDGEEEEEEEAETMKWSMNWSLHWKWTLVAGPDAPFSSSSSLRMRMQHG